MHQTILPGTAAALHKRPGGRWRRLMHLACIVVLLSSLTGCVLDGFTLSPEYKPEHLGATEPVASGSTWMLAPTSDLPATVYLRVFRVGANVYAMEQFVDEGGGKPATFVVTAARFIPLGDAWYALHWQEKDSGAQGYYLARVNPGAGRPALVLLEPSAQADKVIQLAQGTEGLRVEKKTFRTGLAIDASNEAQVLRLLKALTVVPGLRTSTLQAIEGIPSAVAKQAHDAAGNAFSRIDHRDFSDHERGAVIAGYFQALHAQGDGWGSYGLARFMHQGWSMPKDVRQARELARLAIERGVPQAANLLGIQAYYGMEEAADPTRALKYFQQAADAGEPRAYLMLGIAHMDGQGVPRDDAKARFWLEKAEAHVPYAKASLAEVLLREKQSASDARAVDLVEGAITGGHVYAYALRGWMHEHGRGGPVDQDAATKAYVAGAEGGDPHAQWKAGERLIRGLGAPVDRASGQKWLQAAAQAGIAEAGEALAKFQAEGAATPEDDWRGRALRVTDQSIAELHKRKRTSIAGLRVDLKNSRKGELQFELLALSRELREEILRGSENGDLAPGEYHARLSKAQGDIVQIESTGRNFFSLRLPDGRIATLRPDGRYIALAHNSGVEFDASVLPRPGDQLLERSAESVLVEYEQAWSNVPAEDPRIVATVAELNRLIGTYRCEQKLSVLAIYQRNAQDSPAVVVDIGGTVRHRRQQSVGAIEQWEDIDWYVPLGSLSRVEAGRTISGCGYVHLHCAQNRRCAVTTSKGATVETSSLLSINFQRPEQAQRAAQLLQGLIGQSQ